MKSLVAAGGVAAAAVVLTTQPAVSAPTGYGIRIVGTAAIDQSGAWGPPGTTVLIPVHIRCPKGEVGAGVFAGFPGYFENGLNSTPYQQSHTGPTPSIVCTGKVQRYTFVGRSISKNQDPVVYPYQYFRHGKATVVVEARMRGFDIRDTRVIQIVVRSGQK